MIYFLQQSLNALQLGSIYALIALGYTMVYGVLVMINFAHGDLFMLGAFFAFVGVTVLKLPLVATLLLAMLLTAALGVLIERLAYKPLRQAPRVSVIITALGVGIFLENLTLVFCDGKSDKYFPPGLLPDIRWTLGGITLDLLHLMVIALSLILMVLLDWMIQRTKVGMAMRAIAWDRTVVPLMGVPVDLVISLTFAIGAGLGGAAGVMYGLAYQLDPYMGITVGWKAFIAAVVGGIGNVRGAMLGGFILGTIEIFVPAYLPSTYRDFIEFSLLIALLIFKPYGILGQPRVQKV